MNETPETLSEWLLTQTGDMQVGFDHVDAWGVDRADRDALRERVEEARHALDCIRTLTNEKYAYNEAAAYFTSLPPEETEDAQDDPSPGGRS